MWRLIFFFFFPIGICAQQRFQFTESKMGSPFTIIFYDSDSTHAQFCATESFQLVDSLNEIFSDYSPTSEISLLLNNKGDTNIILSNELLEIIVRAKAAYKKSNRAFDITMGALSQLWRNAKAENRFPSKKEIKSVKKKTGFNNISINEKNKTILFRKEGRRFDFGGIVKGYATEKVIDYLKSKNINSALVDAGGDIAMSSPPPGKTGWTVAMNLPERGDETWESKLKLSNRSVATSGDVYQYTLHKEKKYSHIINPRTGYGVTNLRNVTVIAGDGATADWLATACSILSIKKAKKLVLKEKAELFIAQQNTSSIKIYKTAGFDQFISKKD